MKLELRLSDKGKTTIFIEREDKSMNVQEVVLGAFIKEALEHGCHLVSIGSYRGPEMSTAQYEIRLGGQELIKGE